VDPKIYGLDLESKLKDPTDEQKQTFFLSRDKKLHQNQQM
jgi:hypothetical protein